MTTKPRSGRWNDEESGMLLDAVQVQQDKLRASSRPVLVNAGVIRVFVGGGKKARPITPLQSRFDKRAGTEVEHSDRPMFEARSLLSLGPPPKHRRHVDTALLVVKVVSLSSPPTLGRLRLVLRGPYHGSKSPSAFPAGPPNSVEGVLRTSSTPTS